MLGFYKKISTLFGPLFKPDDEQSDAADMFDLESEKYTDQEKKGLKILTPSEMLSKLSITLAQLKAGNNYKKLQNEIRQLFFFCTDQKN